MTPMKLGTNKACVSMTQGAAFDLKDQVAKPYPPAMMRSLRGMGTATAASGAEAATGLVPSSSTSPRADRNSAKSGFRSADYDGHRDKCNASEEAFRMVMYLSCWGPN